MNIFFTCLFVGISLSMDAFSLALVYGTYGISFKGAIVLSCIVGLFHFFMPLFGLLFGYFIMQYFLFSSRLVVGIIFSIIGIEMIISVYKNEDIRVLSSFWGYVLFGFTVSIDSFSTGIGLSFLTKNYIMACSVFMVCSGLLTYLGIRLGNRFHQRFGGYATVLGGIMMIILAIYFMNR